MMETLPTPDIFGYTVFCDDIRVEVGGKLSFIGCYFNDMYIYSDFPVVLNKFCIAVNYWQKGDNVKLPISFMVFFPGDPDERPSVEFGSTEQLTAEVIEHARDVAIKSGVDDPKFVTFTTQISLLNIAISQPGYIKVRAVRDNKLIRIGSLRVQASPSEARPSAASFSPPL